MEKKEDSSSKIWSDPRFSHLIKDPRFKRIPQKQQKVKIDERFQSMFQDDKFQVSYPSDKYGRKSKSNRSQQNEGLKKYYEASESSEDEEKEKAKEEQAILQNESGDEDEFGNSKLLKGQVDLNEDVKSKLQNLEIDYARGEAALLTDSSSEEESESDDENELILNNVWGELDHDAPRTDESTRRLAACNMDWDRIRAVDIMVLCSSFLPPGGSITKISVYPSEFGKERMKEEEISGPNELMKEKTSDNEDNEDETSEFNQEKLRQYQLNRLKYFYAVIECDSVGTADKIYAECDGLEYESTANVFDLRFIPDDVSFEEDVPRDTCTSLPDFAKYQPRIFSTKALQQGKVELTWDENDLERKEISEKLFTGDIKDIPDSELKKYVACSSESEGESSSGEHREEESSRQSSSKGTLAKYRDLLNEIKSKEESKKKQKIENELTWGIGVKEEISAKNTQKDTKDANPFEKMVEKMKAKRKAKKKKHVDAESSDDVPSDIDMNDPYFAEEFDNKEFRAPKSKSKDEKKNKESPTDDSDHEAELALLLEDNSDQRKHFNLKSIQKEEEEGGARKQKKQKFKKKKRQVNDQALIQDDFAINVHDERFQSVFSSADFNIDPTNPQFKKTKAMENLIEEKLKRRRTEPEEAQALARDRDLSLSVKRIKRKFK